MNTGKKILLVEDEPTLRQITKMSLEMIGGFQVRTAEDLETASQQAAEFLPDLVLLDYTLDQGNGLEVLAALRKLPGLEKLTAILVTGRDDLDEAAIAGIGITQLIQKPFNPETLPQRLNQILGT